MKPGAQLGIDGIVGTLAVLSLPSYRGNCHKLQLMCIPVYVWTCKGRESERERERETRAEDRYIQYENPESGLHYLQFGKLLTQSINFAECLIQSKNRQT